MSMARWIDGCAQPADPSFADPLWASSTAMFTRSSAKFQRQQRRSQHDPQRSIYLRYSTNAADIVGRTSQKRPRFLVLVRRADQPLRVASYQLADKSQ
jgi:hypothetical protein